MLEELVQQGKCRFYGISTNNLDIIKAMSDLDMLNVLQYQSSMLDDSAAIHALASKYNIGT